MATELQRALLNLMFLMGGISSKGHFYLITAFCKACKALILKQTLFFFFSLCIAHLQSLPVRMQAALSHRIQMPVIIQVLEKIHNRKEIGNHSLMLY